MNKAELIEHIALQADISKASATRALDALIDATLQRLHQGESVTLGALGSLVVAQRPERIGRNPRTGDPITIKSARMAKFRPGKALKDTLA